MKKQKGFALAELGALVYAAIAIAGFIGWVMNIVDIAGSDFSNITGLLILRIIGVFLAPLGAVLGYI